MEAPSMAQVPQARSAEIGVFQDLPGEHGLQANSLFACWLRKAASRSNSRIGLRLRPHCLGRDLIKKRLAGRLIEVRL